MRGLKTLLAIATALALAGGASVLRAQSACRGECDENFRQCQQSCAAAQSFDDCVSDCRRGLEQCLSACG